MGYRIVIAEDDSLIRLDLREILTDAGHEVIGEAGTGEAALALVQKLHPDVVLMDVHMPQMDGMTAAEILTEQQSCAVVMLTAFSDRPLVERAAAAGVAAYIVKPVSPDQVIAAIDVAMASFRQQQALRNQMSDLADQLETRKLVERAKGELVAQFGFGEQDAFTMLRTAAMNHRMSIAAVAHEVLTGDYRRLVASPGDTTP